MASDKKKKKDKDNITEAQELEIAQGEYLTVTQLSRKINYTTSWISYLAQAGRIKAFKPVGGQWRIPKTEVDRILAEGIPAPPKTLPKPREIVLSEKQSEKLEPRKPEKKEPVNAQAKAQEDSGDFWPLPFKF